MTKPTPWNNDDPPDMPQAGWYSGVPAAVYHGWEFVSQSRLKLMDKSPAHYRANVRTESAAMTLGSYLHALLFEPETVSQHYVVADWHRHEQNVTASGSPSNSTSTKYYKQCKRKAEESGLEVVSQSDADNAEYMVEAVQRNSCAMSYLHTANRYAESCIVWFDERYKLWCKARMDLVVSGQFMLDAKTCRDARAERFSKSIKEFGYHRQAAWYLDGWNTLAKEGLVEPIDDFILLAIDKDVPTQVTCASLHRNAIDLGRCENIEALADLEFAMRTNEWPGYPNPTAFDLPEWAYPDPGEVE